MDEKEQEALIGRTLLRYTETKKRHARLLAYASEFGERLTNVATYLKSIMPDGGLRQGNPCPDLSEFPHPNEIKAIVEHTLQLKKEEQELRQRLCDLQVVEFL